MQSLPSVPPLSSRPLAVPIEAESSSPPDGRDLRPCPLPGHLVAIQMDPVGMVRALDLDEEAVKAAEVLATASQKYLVVISLVRFRLSVYPSSPPLIVTLLIGAGRHLHG